MAKFVKKAIFNSLIPSPFFSIFHAARVQGAVADSGTISRDLSSNAEGTGIMTASRFYIFLDAALSIRVSLSPARATKFFLIIFNMRLATFATNGRLFHDSIFTR